MPFIKISGLTTATAVSATNQFEINQNSTSRSATVAQVAAFARGTATDTVVLPAGTVSAPGLTFTGDTNTGIYSPAADTIAFTEGGVEAMRITASGQLGLGTTNPSAKMTIADAVEAGTRYLGNGLTSAGLFVGYNAAAYIYNDSNTPMLFGTNAAERMRITAAGLVGIGTSGPASNLDVATSGAGSAGNVVRVFNSTDGASAGAISLVKFGSTATTYGPYTANTVGVNSAFTNLLIGTETAHPSIFYTNNTERMRIGANGRVGFGTSSTDYPVDIQADSAAFGWNIRGRAADGISVGRFANNSNTETVRLIAFDGGTFVISNTSSTVERMRIDASGNVGIGEASAGDRLVVRQDQNASTRTVVTNQNAGASCEAALRLSASGASWDVAAGSTAKNSNAFTIGLSTNEFMRITSGGNVGIGTSSPATRLAVNGGISATENLFTSTGSGVWFSGANGFSTGIASQTTDMLFYSSGIERMRITAAGNLLLGKSAADNTTPGFNLQGDGFASFSRNANIVQFINRNTSDGDLVGFLQDGVGEGSISVSGTTVSYNGGHLARWSQLPTKQRDPALLKGTVLSNLDEMCEWLDAEGNPLPNEQLNRMKISDVEGDPNVAGVFVNWDNDDQANPYDMNIAMTGDMIIRIAQGIAVQKGMLLISAGDGTAKPQGDDIVRSKTIAKVTSNHVTCTYPDGSYCVPCVLMAC